MGCQPWKSSKTQTSIHYTISRDNTGGESARQAKLLNGFGRKGGVYALTGSRAFVGDGEAAEDNHDKQGGRAVVHDPPQGFINLHSPIHDISYSKDDRPEIKRLGEDLNEAIQAVWPRRHDIRHSGDEDLKKSSEASESGIKLLKTRQTTP
jgi:hypothetical protein